MAVSFLLGKLEKKMSLYDQYGNPIGQPDDAHVQSNYKQWKEYSRLTMMVDVDLANLGVSDKKIAKLVIGISIALKYKIPFALFTTDAKSLVIFIPELLKSKQENTWLTYGDEKFMLNAIKLVTIEHHEIQLVLSEGHYIQFNKKDANLLRKVLPHSA